MFCTVVVVCPAGSKVSGSMPTAMEKAPPPPSPSAAGASGSSTLQAATSRASAAAAATDLLLEVRRRAVVVVFMVSRSDGVARWTDGPGTVGAGRRSPVPGHSGDHRHDLGEVAGTGVPVAEAVAQCPPLPAPDLLGRAAGAA